jgi:dedicated sortase system histidine kinase
MSLRKQLLIFSLLTLVLPWAGYRYVQEMEAVLRAGLEQSLIERASTVAGGLTGPMGPGPARVSGASGPATTIHAPLLGAAPRVDGSHSDWNLPDERATALGTGQRFWAGVYDRFLYLTVEVVDDAIVYQSRPGEPPFGDRVVVLLRGPEPVWLLFSTAAPGPVRAQRTAPPLFEPQGAYDDRIQAAWRATGAGFELEMRIPSSVAGGALGLAVVDVDPATGGYEVSLSATWDAATDMPGALVSQDAGLQAALAGFARAGDRYRVIDTEGWVVAEAGTTSAAGRFAPAPARGIGADLIRYLLQTDSRPYSDVERVPGRITDATLLDVPAGQSAVAWYRGNLAQDAIVVAGVPLTSDEGFAGALLLEQESDAILTATNRALVRLITLTLGASLIAMLGMLAFATYLSTRVSRLAHAAEHALGPKGEILVALPGQRAGDEIGALARSFVRLLERLREYTEYLRSLTSKLSHELRTPLAVVSTSLDNLDQEITTGEAREYLQRLRQGADRLDGILVAMSEATRIEQAIGDTAIESFDLSAIVSACATAYADVYPSRQFAYSSTVAGTPDVEGSQDLIAQFLDKLVDNAVSFSEAGSRIEIGLDAAEGGFRVSVSNQGPQLPEHMRSQLFDSLVSVRTARGDRPHLGLGLYVASLIAEFHRGRLEADNIADGSGVCVSLWLPAAKPR